MVSRVYVEKREGLDNEALFASVCRTVLSEPQLDLCAPTLPAEGDCVFAWEYLPGQFDQRADSAEQCIQLISQGARPRVATARVYILYGGLSAGELAEIKKYLINPVEAREASLEPRESLALEVEAPQPVRILEGFCALDRAGLDEMRRQYGLAMDTDDLEFCRGYFAAEGRDPSFTELRMIDTYWSDHCRHTTFLTTLDGVEFGDERVQRAYERYLSCRRALGRKKPVNLMDVATLAAKVLRREGKLDALDESEEINACTVKITVERDGKKEPWLLLFKNETHNHPTEIEPFGGAATCIGGAIRDPLSGRSYVYAAMRVTGAADPLTPVSRTIPGKLPQRKLVTTAANGYSSYGNQIGLATGLVQEIYHPGYVAKRLEIGAVVGAAPQENVRREEPTPGDVVLLLGGRTGRDGCGGATGSSKAHSVESLSTCGAEVQKGNAPEERKLQRLFRNGEATRLIKRCNDFGAGGVSVAVGELADGLDIDLDRVPKKYEGLDGTELAISESQERMAVVVAPADARRFIDLAQAENLEATPVARVTDTRRLRMTWRGRTVVDISRDFLNSNGAEKHIRVSAKGPERYARPVPDTLGEGFAALVSDLNCCSQRGLSERFDATIGAGSVLMPFGGARQRTPIQAMAHKIPLLEGETDDCSVMSFGFDPFLTEKDPYTGAYLAVVESLCRLAAAGAEVSESWLSFQEYFPHPGKDPARWGAPLSALLGAFEAQLDYGCGAIGGKDSMSGSFEDIDVPPTLVSFAVTMAKTGELVSPELKRPGSRVVLKTPAYDGALPVPESQRALFAALKRDINAGRILSVWTPGMGGVAEGLFKMCIGNGLGLALEDGASNDLLFSRGCCGFICEVADEARPEEVLLGRVTAEGRIVRGGESVSLDELEKRYEEKLSPVYPTAPKTAEAPSETLAFAQKPSYSAAVKRARPRVLIPVFPGTNCEYDSARAAAAAGLRPEIFVIRNQSAEAVRESAAEFARRLSQAQILFLPGGFSGGDEPDGSAKLIASFLRSGPIREQAEGLLHDRDGLMLGICNGFQALIKLGLVPFGHIVDTDENCPTLTYNTIGRHQSLLARTRVVSAASPWLLRTAPGEIYTVPVSHGEGRFLASETVLSALREKGQIATQYVDMTGAVSNTPDANPNGSAWGVEGILSPDGRVFGKMGHAERIGQGLYKNVPGRYDMQLFASAGDYYR